MPQRLDVEAAQALFSNFRFTRNRHLACSRGVAEKYFYIRARQLPCVLRPLDQAHVAGGKVFFKACVFPLVTVTQAVKIKVQQV